MRLIDADNLIKEIHRYVSDVYCIDLRNSKEFAGDSKAENYCEGLYEATELIDDAITIDAEPVKHGHWIEAHDNDGMDYECSNRKCKCRISYNGAKVSGDFNYCPNCGAKMDEVSE